MGGINSRASLDTHLGKKLSGTKIEDTVLVWIMESLSILKHVFDKGAMGGAGAHTLRSAEN